MLWERSKQRFERDHPSNITGRLVNLTLFKSMLGGKGGEGSRVSKIHSFKIQITWLV